MQGNNGQQGNQSAGQGQKSGGLSWSQSAPSHAGGTPTPASTPKPAATVAPVATKPAAKNTNTMPSAKTTQQSQGSGRLIGIFISGVIVGLIIGWGWFSLRADDAQEGAMASSTVKTTTETPAKTNTNTPTSTGTKAPAAVSSGTLDVLSQSAGLTVKVASISVAVPTWVLVMDNNNGTPGNGFGAQMFFPGDKSGTVDLLRATVPGKSYFVAEFVDNGDHKFSRETDTQVTGISGAPLLVEFSAQ